MGYKTNTQQATMGKYVMACYGTIANQAAYLLVGGLEQFLFVHLLGMSSSSQPTFIFFRGVGQPPTSYSLL